MGVEATDRIDRLESDMQELKAQNYKFESWFQEAAQSDQDMTQRISVVAQQVQAHQEQLLGLQHTVHQQGATIQSATAEMRAEMTQGFSNIEALLTKKHRSS